jgi:Flp pilus assembly pilin Flp
MKDLLRGWIAGEAGTTAIEYALIGTLVGVAIIAALQNFSGMVEVLYAVVGGLSFYF